MHRTAATTSRTVASRKTGKAPSPRTNLMTARPSLSLNLRPSLVDGRVCATGPSPPGRELLHDLVARSPHPSTPCADGEPDPEAPPDSCEGGVSRGDRYLMDSGNGAMLR